MAKVVQTTPQIVELTLVVQTTPKMLTNAKEQQTPEFLTDAREETKEEQSPEKHDFSKQEQIIEILFNREVKTKILNQLKDEAHQVQTKILELNDDVCGHILELTDDAVFA